MLLLGDDSYLILHIVSDGKESLAELPVSNLRQKVRLVLYGVWTGAEPFLAFGINLRLGIVASGNEVIIMPLLLIEGSELDQTITHHIGIRRQTCTNLVHRVLRYLIPVFLVAVNHFQPTAIFTRHSSCHLQVLLTGTIPFFFLFGPYLDIETVRVQTESGELIHHDTTVHTTRKQHCNLLVLYLCYIHISSLFRFHMYGYVRFFAITFSQQILHLRGLVMGFFQRNVAIHQDM